MSIETSEVSGEHDGVPEITSDPDEREIAPTEILEEFARAEPVASDIASASTITARHHERIRLRCRHCIKVNGTFRKKRRSIDEYESELDYQTHPFDDRYTILPDPVKDARESGEPIGFSTDLDEEERYSVSFEENENRGPEQCTKCNGSGRNRCYRCNGTGRRDCTACDTDRTEPCPNPPCHSGYVRCQNCSGGKVTFENGETGTCPVCKGNPKEVCPTCKGESRIPCRSCEDGTVTCDECDVDNQVDCSVCDGVGKMVRVITGTMEYTISRAFEYDPRAEAAVKTFNFPDDFSSNEIVGTSSEKRNIEPDSGNVEGMNDYGTFEYEKTIDERIVYRTIDYEKIDYDYDGSSYTVHQLGDVFSYESAPISKSEKRNVYLLFMVILFIIVLFIFGAETLLEVLGRVV